MSFYSDYMPSFALFEKICNRVDNCVRKHEKKRSGSAYGDCYVRNDNLGPPQIEFYIISLRALTPRLVADLRKILTGYPRWEIIVIICPPDDGAQWPEMGLRIREKEVVDDLQRQHFPLEFQNLQFEGARPGTPDDWARTP